MKNLLTATLPGLALLALGGCATSGALTTTTESDGAYYSSADQTTSNSNLNSVYANRSTYSGQPQSVAGSANPDGFRYGTATTANGQPASTAENANPDYVAGTGYATEGYNTSTLGSSTDYYANQLSNNPSGFGVPYTGPGVSSYSYSPAVSVAPSFYGSPFGYGLGLSIGYGYGGFGGFGYPAYGYGGGFGYPYGGFYDPFYSPFYSPFGYGYGLGFGYGGFGGFGYPAYGFGGFGYPYGGFGYGYGGYGGYGAYRTGSLAPGSYATDGGGRFLSGPRVNRGGMLSRATTTNPAQLTGSPAPGATGANMMAGRRGAGTMMGGFAPTGGAPQATQRGAFGSGMAMGQPASAAPGATPNAMQPARRGFFGGFFGNGSNAGQPNANQGGFNGQQNNMNMGRRGGGSFSQGGFSQPQMQQRSYSQPQMQQRSFSQPSFSPGRSFGGGGGNFGGGGGSFGGGGGGRRGGR